MPIKKPRGLRGLVLLAKEWSRDSGLLVRAAAHRNRGEGESAEKETVGRGLRDGGDGGDDPIAAGGAGKGYGRIARLVIPRVAAARFRCHVVFKKICLSSESLPLKDSRPCMETKVILLERARGIHSGDS